MNTILIGIETIVGGIVIMLAMLTAAFIVAPILLLTGRVELKKREVSNG